MRAEMKLESRGGEGRALVREREGHDCGNESFINDVGKAKSREVFEKGIFRSEFERQAKILALFLLFTADGQRSGY